MSDDFIYEKLTFLVAWKEFEVIKRQAVTSLSLEKIEEIILTYGAAAGIEWIEVDRDGNVSANLPGAKHAPKN